MTAEGHEVVWRSSVGRCKRHVSDPAGSESCGFCQKTISPEQAYAEVRAAGYTPTQDYPGVAMKFFDATCDECDQPRRVNLNSIRAGTRCKHLEPITEEDAVQRCKDAGFLPKEPFPGAARVKWLMECMECGALRRPSLSMIDTGWRCMHVNPEKKWW